MSEALPAHIAVDMLGQLDLIAGNNMKYTCPCCGYLTFAESPGSYEVCPICFWEDDALQLAFPDLVGGANKISLIEAQKNFLSQGASEARFSSNVRQPKTSDLRDSSWHPIDLKQNKFLKWSQKADRSYWDTIKNRNDLVLYYWKQDYFLL